jgi:magnesium transporter
MSIAFREENDKLPRNTNFLQALVSIKPGGSKAVRAELQAKNKKLPSGLEPKSTKLRVEEIDYHNLRWINIERPGSDEVSWLQQNFSFDPLHLEDITGQLQRPKIDEFEDDYIFLVLHFPRYDKVEKVSYAEEVDIFISDDYVIIVHDGELHPLIRLFEQCKGNSGKKHGLMSRGSHFLLYKIIDILVDYCFPITYKLSERLEILDQKIFTSTKQSVIEEISVIRRDIMAVRRILKPQISVLSSLERRKRIIQDDEELEGYYADITDHINKIWDSLEEYKEIVEGLSSTYDTLATHRLNQVIKTLTVISVMILPMTLISGVYGMNTALPFANDSNALPFWGIITFMVVLGAAMIAVFRWRKWL